MRNIGIIIQARTSSTRLPSKVLLPFWKDETILSIQIKELEKLKIPLIVATTHNAKDDTIAEVCRKLSVRCYRGNEEDVLNRFIEASGNANYVIRICSDNPFLQAKYILPLIQAIDQDLDYVSYVDSEGTPAIKTHWGLYGELVKVEALKKAHIETESTALGEFYREHVTNYIYEHPDIFSLCLLEADPTIFSRKDLRFTVDTKADFENMQNLYQLIVNNQNDFSIAKLVEEVDDTPTIAHIMSEGIYQFKK